MKHSIKSYTWGVLGGLGVAGLFLFLRSVAEQQQQEKERQQRELEYRRMGTPKDVVEEASIESFPASDAPAWH